MSLSFLRQKPVLIGGAIGLFLLVTMFLLFLRLKNMVVTPLRPENTSTPAVTPTPPPPPDPDRDRTILLLGYGGGGHAGGRLTDTMMLTVVQPKQQRIVMISMPRDMWVQLPLTPDESIGTKINAAYSYGLDTKKFLDRPREFTGAAGGGQLAKYAVKQVTGLEPEYFIAVDFAGFIKAIDTLGGVNVKVTVPFTDEWYPIEGKENETCDKTPEELAAIATLSGTKAEQSFPCRYEKLEFLAGKQHMDGETALKFVRSRHSNQDGGDFARVSRQRAILQALKNQVFSLQAVPKLPSMLTTLSSHISTDIPLSEWDTWLQRADELDQYEIIGITIDDKTHLKASKSSDGQFILIPKTGDGNWTDVQNWIIMQLSGVNQ